MTTTVKVLIPAKNAENTQTTQYTVSSGVTTIIDKFTATNYSASAASLSRTCSVCMYVCMYAFI
jgi:hypothetical protein